MFDPGQDVGIGTHLVRRSANLHHYPHNYVLASDSYDKRRLPQKTAASRWENSRFCKLTHHPSDFLHFTISNNCFIGVEDGLKSRTD